MKWTHEKLRELPHVVADAISEHLGCKFYVQGEDIAEDETAEFVIASVGEYDSVSFDLSLNDNDAIRCFSAK